MDFSCILDFTLYCWMRAFSFSDWMKKYTKRMQVLARVMFVTTDQGMEEYLQLRMLNLVT